MDGKVISVVASTLELPEEQVSTDTTMKETDTWDSLKHMDLVAAIERSFEVELTFDDIVSMQSVKDIENVLTTKGALQ